MLAKAAVEAKGQLAAAQQQQQNDESYRNEQLQRQARQAEELLQQQRQQAEKQLEQLREQLRRGAAEETVANGGTTHGGIKLCSVSRGPVRCVGLDACIF